MRRNLCNISKDIQSDVIHLKGKQSRDLLLLRLRERSLRDGLTALSTDEETDSSMWTTAIDSIHIKVDSF